MQLSRTMRMTRASTVLSFAFFAAAPTLKVDHAVAHDYRLGDLQIGHTWTKPAAAGSDADLYAPIFNMGNTEAKLVAVSSPISDSAQLHGSADDGDLPIAAVDLPPGKPVATAPWREHVVLTNLKRTLVHGDSVKVTFDFGRAGTQVLDVEVEDPSGD